MIGLKVVDHPTDGSEAHKKAVLKGDFITAVDGQNIATVDALIDYMASNAGKVVKLELLRDALILEKDVNAGALGLKLNPINVDFAYERAMSYAQKKLEYAQYEGIIVSTAPLIEGRPVVETLSIVSGECVFGLHLFKDLFASIRDITGGRSRGFQEALREAKEECISDLKRQAWALEADAVIAVDLDYSEISGGGKSMLFVVATGTAVKLSSTE